MHSLKAKSAMEKYRQSQSCAHGNPPPYRMINPRKSLSTSNLFCKPPVPRPMRILKHQTSDPATHGNYSFEKDFLNPSCSLDCHCVNPRISIYHTDSQSPLLGTHLPYQSCQPKYPLSPVQLSQHSQSPHKRSNLQVCQSRDDGGSFSFSDLDPVEEDMEI